MEDADYLVEVDCSKALLVGWIDRLQEALLFRVAFADPKRPAHSFVPALAVGLLELGNQLFYFFDGDCIFFLTCILIEQRVVHDKFVQFRLFVALPPSNAIDSEVVLTYWAELLVIL